MGLAERRKWFSFATVDVEREKHNFKVPRNNSSLLDFSTVFLELTKLIDHSSYFERLPVVKFGFEGEIGHGAGVMREFFDLFDEKMIPDSLMEPCPNPNFYEFSKRKEGDNCEERLTQASFIGILFAIGLIYGHVIPFQVPPYMLKMLLDLSLDISDLKEVDIDFYENKIKYLQCCPDEELLMLELYFTQVERVNGILTDIELVEGGAKKQVTPENLDEYLMALCDHKIYWDRRDVLNEFVKSFHQFVPKELISPIFTVSELRQMVSVDTKILLSEWKKNTEYSNCTAEQKEMKWFWDIVASFSDFEKKYLLAFCTGSKYLPAGGFERLAKDNYPFTIQYQEKLSNGTLPSARTCFNTLILPASPTKQKLREILKFVVMQQARGVGFAFV